MAEGGDLASVVAAVGTDAERVVPVRERLFVGRECSGIDDSHRLVLPDAAVSRHHLEIRLDYEQDRAFVVDMSTNGTRLNGVRIERAIPVQIVPGDKLLVGETELEFRSDRFRSPGGDIRGTFKQVSVHPMAMAVGDIISFSTISQYTSESTLFSSLEALYADLRSLLIEHRGTVNNYVGDAFFGMWDTENDDAACEHAVQFSLDAADLVGRIAPDLPLRDPSNNPIRMGWAVVLGPAAVSWMTGMIVVVLGDATNLAFRIAGLAGRDLRGEVLVTQSVVDAIGGAGYAFGPPEEVTVKGRTGTEVVFSVARAAHLAGP